MQFWSYKIHKKFNFSPSKLAKWYIFIFSLIEIRQNQNLCSSEATKFRKMPIFHLQNWPNKTFYQSWKHYRPGQANWELAVWKFQDFSVIQILREIKAFRILRRPEGALRYAELEFHLIFTWNYNRTKFNYLQCMKSRWLFFPEPKNSEKLKGWWI